MTAATLPIVDGSDGSTTTRDPFMPRSAQRNGPALALALIAHALLVIVLALSVNWHTADDSPVTAEVWSAVPQAAAPRAVEPPPTPVATPKPQPPVERTPPPAPTPPAPTPPTPALPDPQIAIQKARREEARREQAEAEEARRKQAARDQAQRAKDALAAKQAALEKQRGDKEKLAKAEADQAAKDQPRLDKLKAEKTEKADKARLDALRTAQLSRLLGQAGAAGGPTDTGSALRSAGPSAGYAGRIRAQIKRNIHFFDTVSGNPVASVEVRVAPDGTITGRRLLRSSGLPGFDAAVLKAIDLTAVLPRDVDGRVPPVFQIDFKPNE